MSFFKHVYVLKIFSLVGLSVMLFSILNKSLYTHSHKFASGEIITHAHPFDQNGDHGPIKSHEHTSLEYLALSVFNYFSLSIFLFTLLTFVVLVLSKFVFPKRIYKQLFFHYKKNKSPPVIYSF